MAGNGTMARRALLGAALTGAGAVAGVVVAPDIVGHARSDDAIKQAYNKGLADGRQAILEEFRRRGVSIVAAQAAATTTQSATKVIAQPVANLLVAASNLLGQAASDTLSTLVSALETAQQWVAFLSSVADLIGKIKDLFAGWQSNLDTLTVSVDALPAADVGSALDFIGAAAEVLPELVALV